MKDKITKASKPSTTEKKQYKIDKSTIEDPANKKHLIEFQKSVVGKKPFVILVHAHWCGHCNDMQDDWDKAATIASKAGHNVVKLEHAVMQELMAKKSDELFTKIITAANIQGFPYVASVSADRKGKGIDVREYAGKMNKSDLSKFMLSV